MIPHWYQGMELRHLRYFVAVAEGLNIRRAAEKLRISQPPISRQLNDLESEIGVKLFDRSTRKLKLTQAGECFLKEATEILDRVQHATQLAQAVSRGETGTLVIAYGGPVSGMLPASAMRQCRDIYPWMELVIKEMSPRDQVHGLLENKIDLGYVGLNPVELQDIFCFESVRKVEVLVALPSNHPLIKKDSLRLEELAREHFIMVERTASPTTYDRVINILKSGGFVPNVAHEADKSQNLLRLVAAGFGIALVPDLFRNYSMPDVVFRPLKQRIHVDWHVAWRRDNDSPLLKTFLSILREDVRNRYGDQTLMESA
jgi:DNA-binding transcriptional LysR family regulator